MNTVIINATANKTSGVLSILRELIDYLETNCFSDIEFHLFTVVDDFDKCKNLKIHKFPIQSWTQRIKWDNGGLERYCKRNNIFPNLIISMQNTCTKYKQIPQLVYYQFPFCIFPYKWNPFKKDERLLFLYTYFYGYFVALHNKNALYVVQLPCVKDALVKNFHSIKSEKVFIIKPNEPNFSPDKIFSCEKKIGIKRFLYPATPFVYKNHKIIIDAIKKMTETERLNIEILFTVPETNNIVANRIKDENLENTIKCIGMNSYEKLLEIYKSSDALLFPSKIESYGLPQIEAAKFGIPVFVSDLPYAHDVLGDYNNVSFLDPDNAVEWANVIRNIDNYSVKEQPKKQNNNPWEQFMNLAMKLIGGEL